VSVIFMTLKLQTEPKLFSI